MYHRKIFGYISDEGKAAQVRWRVVDPLEYMRAQGLADTEVIRDYRHAEPGSLVVILRGSAQSTDNVDTVVSYLRDRDCILVYDTDDDIFSNNMIRQMLDGGTPTPLVSKEVHELPIRRYFAKACDGMTVSTPALKMVSWGIASGPSIVVPNAIWHTAVRDVLRNTRNGITIGWSGSGRPEYDLSDMAHAWAIIAKRHPDVEFIVGGYKPKVIQECVPDDRLIYVPWVDTREYMQTMQVDIGCTPLANTGFNRCKSNIKVQEYALAGACVVASPVVYGDIIRHGQNGFIATTIDEWTYYLDKLVGMHAYERARISGVLSSNVLQHYTLETNIQNWLRAYEDIEQFWTMKKGRSYEAKAY